LRPGDDASFGLRRGCAGRRAGRSTLAARLRALVPGAAGIPVRTEVTYAREPAAAITAAAERLDADVVCIAPHGRGTFERLGLGSVAERVVMSCQRPVLVVHPVSA